MIDEKKRGGDGEGKKLVERALLVVVRDGVAIVVACFDFAFGCGLR